MRSRLLALVVGSCLALANHPAAAVDLKATILELRSGRPTDPVSVRVESESAQSWDLKRSPDGTYELSLPRQVKRFAFVADAREQLVSRRIDLRSLPSLKGQPIHIRAHLADREPVTYQTVPRRLELHCRQAQHDACLSYLDYASAQFAGISFIDALFVRVGYNYGLALRNACEFLKYVTCGKAAERFASLIELHPAHRQVFEGEKVTLEMLTAAKAAAKKIEVASLYGVLLVLYDAQLYEDAALVAEDTLQTAQEAAINLQGSGITLDRLRMDAASAWSLHGDALRKQAQDISAALERYKRARTLLDAVDTKTGPVARDLSLINGKIAVLE